MNCTVCGAMNVGNAASCPQCAWNRGTAAGNPQQGFPQQGFPQQGYGHAPYGDWIAPRAGTILVLGILSLVVCSILGPIAWSMGNEELRRIDSGVVDPSTRSNASTGRVCGMISTILMIVGLFIAVIAIGVAGSASSRY